jgi:protease IV
MRIRNRIRRCPSRSQTSAPSDERIGFRSRHGRSAELSRSPGVSGLAQFPAGQQPRPMPASEKRFGCLGVFIVVLLCLSLLFNFAFIVGEMFGVSSGGSHKVREIVLTEAAPNVSNKIAVIRLSGLISSMESGFLGGATPEAMKEQFRHALEDKSVRAIVLAIDSPGGEVTASDEIYNIVRKAREVKKVVVSMGSMAASGGYYTALGGSHIIAHDTTFTGSIGVIMQTLNYGELFGKVGLQMVTFKSGKFKDMLSGSRPITPEEQAYVQGLVMQTYGKFVGIVARERKLPEEELRAGPADGRVLSGKDALAAKLIDDIGDFDAAVQKAMQLGGAPGAAVVEYRPIDGLGRYLRLLGDANQSKRVEINVGPQPSFRLQPGRLYLVPDGIAQ